VFGTIRLISVYDVNITHRSLPPSFKMHGCVAKEPGDDPEFSTIITHSSSPAGFQMHGCVVKQTCENLESYREWWELAQVTQPVFSSVLCVRANK